ncbi:hypothetical protein HPB47_015689 [Ixodes persulcatus]|uniref:Uncharacterized protein n=2 Tax=Ixodes persulcatus TaxID=34615 RepID=A0AC60NYS2_IXOPE|nr:hypothetical protein HPB47_010555 [Ixodes persulcatus]KAG0442497.1 hypothetical protein HPB47_015689 [Ixodes persulcatus]
MALIKEGIVNEETREGRAFLGLDLQSAFDKVKHSAIVDQVSAFGLGARSYAYIRDFLTRRTAKLWVGELDLEERELGSVKAPQGSVVSPSLFNILMIKVAKRLKEQGIEHSIYADNITLRSLSDVKEEAQDDLQKAVNTIEEELEGTGLICSPSKSEFLPSSLSNGWRTAEGGMREGSLTRLVQSFATSNLAYVVAYLNWTAAEKNKLSCMTRKVYKNALGLLARTNTDAMEALGVHNKFKEIVLAQQTAHMARLAKTKTGRAVLEKLNLSVRPPIMDANIPAETM